jgi:hypothetical protein
MSESTESAPPKWLIFRKHSRSRRIIIAIAIYVACAALFAVVAGPDRITRHTPFNHYALLADAWAHGRQDLAHGPPAYAMHNDFAEFEGKTYISFPPFPAMLMLPLVKIAGSAEEFRDGQFIIWLAAIAPAALFLVLEKLRRTARSSRSEAQNVVLALLFAFGSVYFFTAVQGTVWFAAHVVCAGLVSLYLLWALDAERPLLAGLMMGFTFLTRPHALLVSFVFAMEAIRVCCKDGLPTDGALLARVKETWSRVDKVALAKKYAVFAVPILAAMAFGAWTNGTRYHNPVPWDFGHEHLGVAWQARMLKWGLFSYHYLAKNLGVSLTILPWLPPKGGAAAFGAPFKINEHGLALWFTVPIYFWLLRPKTSGFLYWVVAIGAILPAFMLLLYQNSGWQQFGYRFSNDYAPLLFVLLAIGARPMRSAFALAAVWGIAWNLFGAVTFGRGGAYDRFYFREGSQTVLYQPD